MHLADFILSNVEAILEEWEVFARSIGAASNLDQLALRDHAKQILEATVQDMTSVQTASEQRDKSKGINSPHDLDSLIGASDAHALGRLGLGFDIQEVMSEYRALRASVLRLWHESNPALEDMSVDELTRFNESIDQSISIALASYTRQIDHARDTFLAILGHDLRNPLSAIAMSATLLPLVSDDKNEISNCSEIIANSSSLMERMISDLLDYTRTRLGAGMPVNPAPMNLEILGRELVAEFHAANPDRRIELRTEGDLQGHWDSDRIRQAISNLMGNAVQHGSHDLPITLSAIGQVSFVVIEVHNGGDVIPPEELPKIFDPLVRGASSQQPRSNRPGSIGMGLYIAREVARSHGGQIDVRSTIQDGTSFTIRLPRESKAKVGQPISETKSS